MRRVLLASLPLVTILVIGASFFLLNKQRIAAQTVLGVNQTAAFTVRQPMAPRIPTKPEIKITPVPSNTPTPSPSNPSLISRPSVTPTPPIKSEPSGDLIKPAATRTPTPTSKPLPVKPTLTPTSIPTPTPRLEKQLALTIPSEDTVKNYIIQRINEYRTSVGLGSVTMDSNTCGFAKTRATEIAQSFTHNGFTDRISSHTLPYSSYHEVTENIAMNSDYKQIVAMWINSPGHAENMRKDTPYVCVEGNGSFYAYEGWKP